MPKVYNLYKGPQERENVLFPNTMGPQERVIFAKEKFGKQ
jgi:hypothetical protein